MISIHSLRAHAWRWCTAGVLICMAVAGSAGAQAQKAAKSENDDAANPSWVHPLDVVVNFFPAAEDALQSRRRTVPHSQLPAQDAVRLAAIQDSEGNVAIETLIALVPDPIDARSSGEFDDALSAIQKAAADEDWLLDRHYLPWTETRREENEQAAVTRLRVPLGIQDGTAQLGHFQITKLHAPGRSAELEKGKRAPPGISLSRKHENVPGVLLFRKAPKESRAIEVEDGPNWPTRTIPVQTSSLIPERDPPGKPRRALVRPQVPLRGDRILVVFLVGETQTWGVQRRPFRKALLWASSLGGPSVRIVGPWFSGSADSMNIELAAQKEVSVDAITGTASAWWLSESVQFRLHQLVLPDDDLISRAGEIVRSNPYGKIAFLVESDSAYGRAFDSAIGYAFDHHTGGASRDDAAPLVFRVYGRLSGVRSEWTSTAEAAGMDPRVERLRDLRRLTRLDLQDRGNPSDVVPQVAPFSNAVVGMVLEQIIDSLRKNSVRHVGIVMTDLRDRLFVAQVLHRELPDLTFSFFDAQSLYAHPDLDEALSGAYMFSSFPLEWRDGERLQEMSSDAAAGAYWAARQHLTKQDHTPKLYASVIFDGHFFTVDGSSTLSHVAKPAFWRLPGFRLLLVVLFAVGFGGYAAFKSVRSRRLPLDSGLSRLRPWPLVVAATIAVAGLLTAWSPRYRIVTPTAPSMSLGLTLFFAATLAFAVWSFLSFVQGWSQLRRNLCPDRAPFDEQDFAALHAWNWSPLSALGFFHCGTPGVPRPPSISVYRAADRIFAVTVFTFDELRMLLRTALVLMAALIVAAAIYPFSPAYSVSSVIAITAIAMGVWFLSCLRDMTRTPVLRWIRGEPEDAGWPQTALRVLSISAVPIAALVATQHTRFAMAITWVADLVSQVGK